MISKKTGAAEINRAGKENLDLLFSEKGQSDETKSRLDSRDVLRRMLDKRMNEILPPLKTTEDSNYTLSKTQSEAEV